MKTFLDDTWRERFVLTAETMTPSERALLASEASNGRLRRVIRGVYERSPTAGQRDAAAAHRDLVHARELASEAELIFSHASAAALWRLPRFSSWPSVVHVTAAFASGGRSTRGIIRHSIGFPPDIDHVEGIRVTALARTVVDVARSSSFMDGVMAADAALAGLRFGEARLSTTPGALGAELHAVLPSLGSRTAEQVIAFADAASGSPGETCSRITIARAGLPSPTLQYRVVDDEGEMFADFGWPKLRILGEFDGLGKYLKEEYLQGRSTADVVLAEKRREDRLRRLGWTVVRWGWKEAMSVPLLRTRLMSAGVR